MPNYQYNCPTCNIKSNIYHSMKDNTKFTCESCNSELEKEVTGGIGILFKGTGFYATDYKEKC